MIERVLIKNFLFLKEVELKFSNGFIVITGETGAGKSIFIDALNLLMGDRADYTIIKKNEDKMTIEAEIKITKFNLKLINSFLKEKEIEIYSGDRIILRRELNVKGVSRNFINDSPVNISDLKYLGDITVDIHSQNEHQKLFNKENHIKLLDLYIGSTKKNEYENKLIEYKNNFRELNNLLEKLKKEKINKTEIEDKSSFISFQINEINEVNPIKDEDEILEKELNNTENSEQTLNILELAYKHIYEDEGSIVERLKKVEEELSKVKHISSDIDKILEDIKQTQHIYREAGNELRKIKENINVDTQQAEGIRERLYKLQFLKKKYGSDLKTIIEKRNAMQNELNILENYDNRIASIEKTVNEKKKLIYSQALDISKERKSAAINFEKEAQNIFKETGLDFAAITVDFKLNKENEVGDYTYTQKKEITRLSQNGIEEVEFLVKINKGDELTSLRKTASGGEISRIMLAMKVTLAEADQTQTLVFDEIDTGVSGRIAQKIGKLLKKLSGFHQVISITHLAQVAALADEHFVVNKKTEGENTVIEIVELGHEEKVQEVAKLLSGEKITDASIKSAKELIES